ncbi:MAG TPA: hypothetical protein VNI84_13790 [Pyrinomonadaceae bacterium]|nr:hypothetical protein [Pyrinomonadaceae bacterium]
MSKNISKQDETRICSFCNKNRIEFESSNCCLECIEKALADLGDDTEVFDC